TPRGRGRGWPPSPRRARPADRRPAAQGTRGRRPALRLRPSLRRNRRRTRLLRGRRPPGHLFGRATAARKAQAIMNTVPARLDDRFRAAAAAGGLLDVAYDVVGSPVGDLFVAVSNRGLCAISYDADAERQIERLARGFGSRVLRSPRPIDPAKRQLDEYFEGKRQRFDLEVDLRLTRDFGRTVLEELGRVPFAEITTYAAARARKAAHPRAARAGGTIMQRHRIACVPPRRGVVGENGPLAGWGGGLGRKQPLLHREGALPVGPPLRCRIYETSDGVNEPR